MSMSSKPLPQASHHQAPHRWSPLSSSPQSPPLPLSPQLHGQWVPATEPVLLSPLISAYCPPGPLGI